MNAGCFKINNTDSCVCDPGYRNVSNTCNGELQQTTRNKVDHWFLSPLYPPPLKLFICLGLSLLSFCLSFYCSLSLISPQFATLLLLPFVFHSTVLYLSSLLISLPYSSFLLSFILLFYVLSPLRLRCRGNLTPVSNVCEAGPKSLFWAPNELNKLPEMRFKFPWLANRQWLFLTGQSWRLLQSWYTTEDPEQGFRRCFTDGLNQSLVSSVA